MWIPLVVLAVFATIGGFVGISTAFTGGRHVGGRLNIVNFLDPIIWNSAKGEFGGKASEGAAKETHGAAAASETATAAGVEQEASSSGFNLAHAVTTVVGNHTLVEWIFIIISLIAAGIGMGLGYLFYVKDPRLPDVWAARLRPLYRASYNKHWVDEFYGWAITRRVMDASRAVFAFDSKVIDGGVNGSAWLTRLTSRLTGGADKYVVDGLVNTIAAFIIRLMSPLLRAAQTGFTQNYALVIVLGLIVAIAILAGRDVVNALTGR